MNSLEVFLGNSPPTSLHGIPDVIEIDLEMESSALPGKQSKTVEEGAATLVIATRPSA